MTRRSGLFYGWVVVAVTAVVVLVTAGVRSAPGAFALAIRRPVSGGAPPVAAESGAA